MKSWVSTMIAAPLGRSPRLALSAAGFIATSTSGRVARGQDVVVGEVHLERRDARQRALRGADLGREVRQRHQVVAEDRRLLGEPVTGQLHAVTGVAREPDDHPIELLDLLGHFAPTSLVASARAPRARDGPATRSIVLSGTPKLEHVPVFRYGPAGTAPHDSPAPARTGPVSPCWIRDSRHDHIFSDPMSAMPYFELSRLVCSALTRNGSGRQRAGEEKAMNKTIKVAAALSAAGVLALTGCSE